MNSVSSQLESYFDRLWPICRSLTGPGFRESLKILSEIMPMELLNFKSGEEVFDWTIPDEWTPRAAYFIDPNGVKHADFAVNNLHLLGYSEPFVGTLPLKELKKHLYSLPDQPQAIPYLTSYYQKRWGFCLPHSEMAALPEGEYRVHIDTTLAPGELTVAECVLKGQGKEEILLSSYLCHPSLANNELSGPLVLAFLYRHLAALPSRRYTYRFVITPETIGAVAYLTLRGEHLKKFCQAGYQLTCLGDRGPFTYKSSRRLNALSDRAAKLALREEPGHRILPFDPSDGSDERQYGSPGFNLPVGSLMRTMYGCYPEYHTSLDNKSFVDFNKMADSVAMYARMLALIEGNVVWANSVMKGEPQLGKRGLYPTLGAQKEAQEKIKAMMWLLNLADGTRDFLSIMEVSGQRPELMLALAEELSSHKLLTVKHK